MSASVAEHADPVAALPHAGAGPAGHARLRAEPGDFQVDEDMPIDLEGAGEHLWLQVEKTGWTTPTLADRLAGHYGVRRRDVGYAGLKDRHAVTRQWFSLPIGAATAAPEPPAIEGVRWLAQVRHRRKLKRGAHAGNRFRLVLRDFRGDAAAADAALSRIAERGVPNYFGEQRFGRDGGNLEMARQLFDGRRLKGFKRGIALSAARSHLFNAVLAERVRVGTWDRMLEGDVMALAGSRSVFPLAPGGSEDADNLRRLAALDIHPTGPLPGRGEPAVTAAAAELEAAVLAEHAPLVEGLARAGVDADRRALRLAVTELDWGWRERDLEVAFRLGRGGFATMVLREVVGSVSASE